MLRGRTTVAAATALTLAASAAPLPFAHAADSNATFTKKANAACRAAEKITSNQPETTSKNAVKVLTAERKAFTTLIGKLEALDPPSSKAAKFKSYIKVLDEAESLIGQAVTAAKAKDESKLDAIAAKLKKASKRGTKLAKDLKLTECAS
jgi:hypothetical protein